MNDKTPSVNGEGQIRPALEGSFLNRNDINRRDIKPSNLMSAQELRLNRALIVMPKQSLVDRIKQQFLLSFKKKRTTLDNPRSYEIQIMPGSLSSLKQRFSVSQAGEKEALKPKKASQDKLIHTSSNLG